MENMFKKTVVLSVAVALIMLGLFVDPSAAQVTSVSKRGSFFVLPKINTWTNGGGLSVAPTIDTIVTIGNDGATGTWVKCYWMDSDQYAWDFEFFITANQPVWFSAKTGEGNALGISEFGDNKTGELKCWAIDIDPPGEATEIKKKFNFLYASAVIIESAPVVAAYEYQAWAFNLYTVGQIPSGDPAGPLQLDGLEYDKCPAYLVYNFWAADNDGYGFGGNSTLSLSPCQQDLRQDRAPVCTKAKFDIWNENEIKFTGAYQCVKCYFEGELFDIGNKIWKWSDVAKPKKSGVGGNKFTENVLHTDIGRFRVTPELSTACNGVFAYNGIDSLGKAAVIDRCAGNQGKYPFVGVLVTELSSAIFAPVNVDTYAATTGTGAGVGAATEVKWDAAEIGAAPKR